MKSCKNCLHYEVCLLECSDLDTEASECRLYKLDREGLSLNLRPCIANGKPALFHRWAETEDIILKVRGYFRCDEIEKLKKIYERGGYVPSGFDTEKTKVVEAIIEYEDGTVARVLPERIRFIDGPHRYYDFTERGERE